MVDNVSLITGIARINTVKKMYKILDILLGAGIKFHNTFPQLS